MKKDRRCIDAADAVVEAELLLSRDKNRKA